MQQALEQWSAPIITLREPTHWTHATLRTGRRSEGLTGTPGQGPLLLRMRSKPVAVTTLGKTPYP
jgi:hypothetical protein